MRIFCIAKDSHIFSTKNNSVFAYLVSIYLTRWCLNDVVKLTMLLNNWPQDAVDPRLVFYNSPNMTDKNVHQGRLWIRKDNSNTKGHCFASRRWENRIFAYAKMTRGQNCLSRWSANAWSAPSVFAYLDSTIPLLSKYKISSLLSTLHVSCTARFVSDLVGHPEDRFSDVA